MKPVPNLDQIAYLRRLIEQGYYPNLNLNLLLQSIKIKTKRCCSNARSYASVTYDIIIVTPKDENVYVIEIGPYKWNKPASLYYSEEDKLANLKAAKEEAKLVVSILQHIKAQIRQEMSALHLHAERFEDADCRLDLFHKV